MMHRPCPPPVSQDSWILALIIARTIRCSSDEKDAIQRICTVLRVWNVEIAPNELGAQAIKKHFFNRLRHR